MKSMFAIVCALLASTAWANESIEISSGLKVSVCKGLGTPDTTCLDLFDGLQNATIHLNRDPKEAAMVGTHQEFQKVGDLNIEAVITAYHYDHREGPTYKFVMNITSWVTDDPSSIAQSSTEIDAASPNNLNLVYLYGDVHVFDTWAAMPTLYLGRKNSEPPPPKFY